MTDPVAQITHWQEAQRYLAGGVNSPVRAFGAVGGEPLFLEQGEGAWVTDTEGRRFLDFVMGWGPLILGHRHPEVVAAIRRQLDRLTTPGFPTMLETELARLVQTAFPSVERLRMTSSGTEACMSALRLARACTGREELIVFEGSYHGHGESVLVGRGSGMATFGIPKSAGIPPSLARATHVLPYNDPEAVERLMAARGREIAAIIVEPIACNMGLVPADADFLRVLRRETAAQETLLIFDEVVTAFRLTFGGVQTLSGVTPDLTTLGKILGGGLPCGAFGGRADLMVRLAPQGDVYVAGTLSGSPLSVAAGIATLRHLQQTQPYQHLAAWTGQFCQHLRAMAKGRPIQVAQLGSLFTVFFTHQPVTRWQEAEAVDRKAYATYFHCLLDDGVLMPPSPFETAFVSTAHLTEAVEGVASRFQRALQLTS